MYGVVEAASRHSIVPVHVRGLRKPEYRANGSAGPIVINWGGSKRIRSVCCFADLAAAAASTGAEIAHIRQREIMVARTGHPALLGVSDTANHSTSNQDRRPGQQCGDRERPRNLSLNQMACEASRSLVFGCRPHLPITIDGTLKLSGMRARGGEILVLADRDSTIPEPENLDNQFIVNPRPVVLDLGVGRGHTLPFFTLVQNPMLATRSP